MNSTQMLPGNDATPYHSRWQAWRTRRHHDKACRELAAIRSQMGHPSRATTMPPTFDQLWQIHRQRVDHQLAQARTEYQAWQVATGARRWTSSRLQAVAVTWFGLLGAVVGAAMVLVGCYRPWPGISDNAQVLLVVVGAILGWIGLTVATHSDDPWGDSASKMLLAPLMLVLVVVTFGLAASVLTTFSTPRRRY